MFDVKIELTGDKQIDKVLKGLPQQLTRKIIVSAAKIAARPFIKDAKSRVPVDKGLLRSSIGAITGKRGRQYKGFIDVGPRIKRNRKNHQGWHANLVESGTPAGERRLKKKTGNGFVLKTSGNRDVVVTKINHPGTPAQPFMQPAWTAKRRKVQDELGKSIGIALDRYMKRTIKKNGK